MRRTKAVRAMCGVLTMVFCAQVLTACGKTEETPSSSQQGSSAPTAAASEVKTLPEVDFATEAVVGTDAQADTTITLDGDSISVEGSGASVSGSTVTITAAGSYELTGSLRDGQVLVNTQDEEKVELILNGANLQCSSSAPIYVISSPKKTEIHLQEQSVNIVKDGTSYDVDETDSDAPSAAVFSMDDLEFEGEGTIYITGQYNKGVFSKDDLEIKGGSIYVAAVDDGIRGKDSIEMTGGMVYIASSADGMRTSNETDADKGYILIDGGEIYIEAEQDAIQAVTTLTVNGGDFVLVSGGGSENAEQKASEFMGGGMGGRGGMQMGGSASTTSESDDTASAKGMKAASALTVTGGTFSIDSADDAIHCNGTADLSGGTFEIAAGDDAVHADDTLNVTGGTISVTGSYEGLEAANLNISGGDIHITASDDGLNAAGGNDSSQANGRMGGDPFSQSTGSMSISGGYVVIEASGDGVDANGTIAMTGGTVLVYCPNSNGNAALDYDGQFTVEGGTLLAVGGSGMAQSVSASGQGVLAFTSNMSAGELLHIADSSGSEILTFASPMDYSAVVYSSPDVPSGASCTVSSGGSYSSEAVDGIYSGGTYSGGSELGTVMAS